MLGVKLTKDNRQRMRWFRSLLGSLAGLLDWLYLQKENCTELWEVELQRLLR